jgi:hypothetical protein
MNHSASSQLRKRTAANDFFAAHPIGEIARSLLFSSIGWVFIVIVVYTVYAMVLSRN